MILLVSYVKVSANRGRREPGPVRNSCLLGRPLDTTHVTRHDLGQSRSWRERGTTRVGPEDEVKRRRGGRREPSDLGEVIVGRPGVLGKGRSRERRVRVERHLGNTLNSDSQGRTSV